MVLKLASFVAPFQRLSTLVAPCSSTKIPIIVLGFAILWQSYLIKVLLRSEIPSGICAKLRTVAASNNRVHMPWSLYYCLFVPHICMVLFFTHIPFMVNHTFNATLPERLQQSLLVVPREPLCRPQGGRGPWLRNSVLRHHSNYFNTSQGLYLTINLFRSHKPALAQAM